MPLNMNTIGTGNGCGGGTSECELIIQNNTNVRSKLVSNVYDQDISSINIQPKVYTADLNSESQNNTYRRYAEALYKGCMYQIYGDNNSSSRNYYLCKCEFVTSGDVTTVVKTDISTPFTVNAFFGSSMIQLGDYLYFFNGENVNQANMNFLYRFDGESFTALNTSVDPFTFYFNGSGYTNWGSYYCYLFMFPISSSKYDGTLVLIDLYYYSSGSGNNKYPRGYTGIFNVDEQGFHLLEYRKIGGYYSAGNISPYNTTSGLLATDTTYTLFSLDNQVIKAQKYEISYVYDSGDVNDPTYQRQFTLTETVTLDSASGITYQGYPVIVRVSYPQYDTYLLAYLKSAYTYSSDSVKGRWLIGKWFQLKMGETNWETNAISATYNNGTTAEICEQAYGGLRMYLVTNTQTPFIYMRRSYQPTYYAHAYIDAKFIDWNLTYSSDRALFIYSGYLLKGDTVYCDDGIISYTLNDVETDVGESKILITIDGFYTIKTHVNDAYTYPSFMILDKDNSIVHIKASVLSDGTLEGYFLKGMKVNGTLVTESKKAIYQPINDRYIITVK